MCEDTATMDQLSLTLVSTHNVDLKHVYSFTVMQETGDVILWGQGQRSLLQGLRGNPCAFHIYNNTSEGWLKQRTVTALCKHTLVNMLPVTLDQKGELLAVSCAQCHVIKLHNTARNDTVTAFRSNQGKALGHMCHGENGTMFVAYKRHHHDYMVLELGCTTTKFRALRSFSLRVPRRQDPPRITYLSRGRLIVAASHRPSKMIRAVSTRSRRERLRKSLSSCDDPDVNEDDDADVNDVNDNAEAKVKDDNDAPVPTIVDDKTNANDDDKFGETTAEQNVAEDNDMNKAVEEKKAKGETKTVSIVDSAEKAEESTGMVENTASNNVQIKNNDMGGEAGTDNNHDDEAGEDGKDESIAAWQRWFAYHTEGTGDEGDISPSDVLLNPGGGGELLVGDLLHGRLVVLNPEDGSQLRELPVYTPGWVEQICPYDLRWYGVSRTNHPSFLSRVMCGGSSGEQPHHTAEPPIADPGKAKSTPAIAIWLDNPYSSNKKQTVAFYRLK